MKKLMLMTSLILAASLNVQAFVIQPGIYNGVANNTDSTSCQIKVHQHTNADTIGTSVIEVYINREEVYGFVTDQRAIEQLASSQNANDLMIAGRMLRSGDVALSVNVSGNQLKSFLYSGIDNRSNRKYSVRCVL